MSYDNEVILKVSVIKLVQCLKPLHDFYLCGQRSVDQQRVEKMYAYQKAEFEERGHYSITTTVITLGYCPQHIGSPADSKNQYGIVIEDGQHRANLYDHIYHFTPDSLANEYTIVKIDKVEHEGVLREHFEIINRNYVPVSEYNLNNTIKAVIDGIISWFTSSFDPFYFRAPSGDVLRPFLKIESIRDKLANHPRLSDVIAGQEGNIEKSVEIICDKIDKYNSYLRGQNVSYFYQNDKQNEVRACNNAHIKCLTARKQLFLGMMKDYSWIDPTLNRREIRLRPRILV